MTESGLDSHDITCYDGDSGCRSMIMASFTSQPDVAQAAGPLIYLSACGSSSLWPGVMLRELLTIVPAKIHPHQRVIASTGWARINYLGEVSDDSGCLFAPDLNGKLYLVEGGNPQTYLDLGVDSQGEMYILFKGNSKI